jgi:hypothetical protein
MLFGAELSVALGGTFEYGLCSDGVRGWLAYMSGTSVKVRKSTNQFYDLPSASDVTVDTNAANSNVMLNEQFVVDPVTGRLHLFWDRNEGNGSNPCALVTSHSDTQGATWSTPVVVDDGTAYGNNRFYRVGVGALNGVVAVLYASESSSAFTTQSGGGPIFTQSTDGGATWSSPVTLYASVATTGEPNVSIGEDGTIRVTWYDSGVNANAGGDIYFAAAPWSASGYVWPSTPTRVTTGQTCGRVRHWTSNGVVIATANTNWGGAVADVATVRSTDGGTTWGAVVTQAVHGAGPLTHPWVDFQSDLGGLIWYDTSNNPSPGVYGFKTTADAGETWTTGTPMTTTLATADAPKIVITNDLLWTFGLDASGNLIFAALPLFSPDPASTTSGAVIDNFNRANENPLSNGGTWSLQSGAAAALQIVSNLAVKSSALGSFTRNGSQRNDRTFTEGEIFLSVASGTGITYGTDGRIDLYFWNESTNDQYNLALQENGIVLNILTGGAFTGNLGLNTAIVVTAGDKYVLRTTPNDVVVYRFVGASSDWQELFRARDTSFRVNLSGVIEFTSTTDNPAVDDFGGSALVAPSNSVAPVAAGTVSLGNVLAVTKGTWATAQGATPARYSYQWQSSPHALGTWSNVVLATLPFMTVTDATKDYRVIVTASNSYGTATATSNFLGPATGPLPTVSHRVSRMRGPGGLQRGKVWAQADSTPAAILPPPPPVVTINSPWKVQMSIPMRPTAGGLAGGTPWAQANTPPKPTIPTPPAITNLLQMATNALERIGSN